MGKKRIIRAVVSSREIEIERAERVRLKSGTGSWIARRTKQYYTATPKRIAQLMLRAIAYYFEQDYYDTNCSTPYIVLVFECDGKLRK